MESVLLLNASYEPIKVISWKRAVCLVFADKVEVVEEYEKEIRSVSLAIKAPAVVRLLRYVKMGKKSPPLSRLNILARDDFECQYCGLGLNMKSATIDHIMPRSLGGQSEWTNLVSSCKACNHGKGCKTLKQANMRLRKKPIKPDWLPVVRFKFGKNVPQSWTTFLQAFRAS